MKKILIILLALMAIFVAITNLQAQVNVNMASEFNISVEAYRGAKVCDNWVCYQNYNGLVVIPLDESGNFQDTLFFRQADIYSYAISENTLIYSDIPNGIMLSSNFHIYNITDGVVTLIREFSLDGLKPTIEFYSTYYVISYSSFNQAYTTYTNVYSLDNYELISSYVGLKSVSKIDESTMLVDEIESGQRNIYQIDSEGELSLLYNLDQHYLSAVIEDDIIVLEGLDKVDFYTISDNLSFVGSYNYVYTATASYGFYYHNGVLGYNRYSYQNFCYFELVDVSDLSSPETLHSLDYLTITEPDEIETVFTCFLTCENNNIYTTLANKPLIHLRIDDNVTNFVEMLAGYRSPSRFNLIREDKYFTNDYFDVIITDISDPYNPINIENSYPLGWYVWFKEGENIFCTLLPLSNDKIVLYSLDENDNLSYIDSIYTGNDDPNVNSISLSFDGSNLIYYNTNGVTSISQSDLGWETNWQLDRELATVCDLIVVNNCLYISEWGNDYLDIYQFDDNSIELVTTKHIGSYIPMILMLNDEKEFLTISDGDYGKAYDLREDYLNLDQELNLNISCISSNITKANDLLMYVGKTTFSENTTSKNNICIFRELEDSIAYEGSIVLDFSYSSIKLFISEEDNLKIVLSGMYGTAIYTGTITPNGDLEIDPVPLNVTNYPNPFNPETTISYDLVQKGEVQIDIFNLKGQKVKTLLKKVQDKGNHKVTWQGYNQVGEKVSSGLYFYKLTANGREKIGKMTLLK